jgi:hypothetical protein
MVQAATNQNSPPSGGSPTSHPSGLQQPFVGEYNSADYHEIYIQLPVDVPDLDSGILRNGPGPDCTKSLVITGSSEGVICDEVVMTVYALSQFFLVVPKARLQLFLSAPMSISCD